MAVKIAFIIRLQPLLRVCGTKNCCVRNQIDNRGKSTRMVGLNMIDNKIINFRDFYYFFNVPS